MSMKGFECPNCGSGFCSAIRFWRDGRQSEGFDLYKCHDCDQITKAGTREAVDADWQPPRKQGKNPRGQVNIFGTIENVRDIINPVPKFVEAPDGSAVVVAFYPNDATPEYREELAKMVQELNRVKTGRDQPIWYKYRKIKRGNNGGRAKTGARG